MTNAEAIKCLKSLVEVRKKYGDMQTMKDEIECLEMAIEALEQQPCEDEYIKGFENCRQAVLDIAKSSKSNWIDNSVLFKRVNELPSVNSQEPKTVLYSGDGYADGYMVYDMAECPSCGYEYEDGDKDWGLPFCPNCGQELTWESEE